MLKVNDGLDVDKVLISLRALVLAFEHCAICRMSPVPGVPTTPQREAAVVKLDRELSFDGEGTASPAQAGSTPVACT